MTRAITGPQRLLSVASLFLLAPTARSWRDHPPTEQPQSLVPCADPAYRQVNDSGYLLTIEGHLQGKSMTLEGVDHVPNDKLRQVRGEWRADEQGAHEVAWRSTDGGINWATWFDLSFRPHAASSLTSANQ